MKLSLVQIPVVLDESNGSEIFWMCASANMAVYAMEMTKLVVNCNLVTLQPGSSKLFNENYLVMKYEVDQSFMNSPSFIVFHYYLEGDVVAYYTTANALFNAVIKILQLHCIVFEDKFF